MAFVLKAMRDAMPASVLRSNLARAYVDAAASIDALLTRPHGRMLAPGARDALKRSKAVRAVGID